MIDLIHAARNLRDETRILKPRVQAVGGGIRYKCAALVLDLLRDRIVLRDSRRLSPDERYRLIPAIRNAMHRLGFRPVATEGLHDLPPRGGIIAAHATFVLRPAVEVEPGREDTGPGGSDVTPPHPPADRPIPSEDNIEDLEGDRGSDPSM